MNNRIVSLIVILALAMFAVYFINFASSLIISSPLGQFNATPNTTYLNWTNSFSNNITVLLNATIPQLTLKAFNDSSLLNENYTQQNSVTACQNATLALQVVNSSNAYSRNSTLTTAQNSTNVTMVFNIANCKAGRYSTTLFTIANVTQQNESANVSLVLDLPINNTALGTGMGSFNGQFPINYTTYQSYYFNTSLIPNATAITINMSGWSSANGVDVFLFDNSTPTPVFVARSANKSSTTQTLRYQYLPQNAFWELRVFGNSTSAVSYSGNILYSTLNITNPYTSSTITLLNFSALNFSQTNNTNITIKNSGNINFTNVAETKELYYVKNFSGIGTNNFSFMVPDSAVFNRVKVLVDWLGGSNYSFNLYDLNGNAQASAINQHVQANVSNATEEIYNETTNVSGSTGNWVVQVQNLTNIANDTYNVSVYMYANASAWLVTNYSNYSLASFNNNGIANSSTDVNVNLTIPNGALDGIYKGQLLYLDGNSNGITLPLWLNVTTPVLSVNSSMNTKTFRIDEDTGSNLTRSFTYILNNSGSLPLVTTFTSNPGNLIFTYNLTNGTIIPPQSSVPMNISVTFYSSNSTALYQGAILINATNSTTSLSPHPYSTFNLTLNLNLTNLLNVNIFDIRNRTSATYSSNTNLMSNSSTDNLTIGFYVSYLNGSNISNAVNINGDINETNFTDVWFVEANTSVRIPTTVNITPTKGTNPVYCSGCSIGSTGVSKGDYINATPSGGWNFPGGQYIAHVNVNYTRSDGAFLTGTGINGTLAINNAGLFMSTNVSGSGCSFGSNCNSATITVANGTNGITVGYINVTNYGPMASSAATLAVSNSCTGFSIAQGTPVNCPSTSFAPSGYSSTCLVPITVNTPSSSSSCTIAVSGSPSYMWLNPNGVNITIQTSVATSSNTTSSNTGTSPTTPTSTTTNSTLAFSVAPSIIYVEQSNTNTTSVQIKNNGVSPDTIIFGVDTLTSSWYSINNTNLTSIGTGGVAGFLVTFNPGNADVKDYTGNFKVTGLLSNSSSAFTLRVLPGAQKKTEISTLFGQLNANFTSLGSDLNKTKNQGKNTTDAQAKFDMLKAKLDQANNYLKNGDYFSAYQLVSDIQNLFSQTRDALSKSTVPSSPSGFGNIFGLGNYFMYAIIGVGVAAGAVVAYLFWPTKTPPVSGYKVSTSKPVLGTPTPKKLTDRLQFLKKIKEPFSKIFNRGPKKTYEVK